MTCPGSPNKLVAEPGLVGLVSKEICLVFHQLFFNLQKYDNSQKQLNLNNT